MRLVSRNRQRKKRCGCNVMSEIDAVDSLGCSVNCVVNDPSLRRLRVMLWTYFTLILHFNNRSMNHFLYSQKGSKNDDILTPYTVCETFTSYTNKLIF